MTIDEARDFVETNLDKVFIYSMNNRDQRNTLVRLVGWSFAYRSVHLIVSVDTRDKIPISSWQYSRRDPNKDLFLTRRSVEDKYFWYVNSINNLKPFVL